jgi:hypothetical protein
MKRISMLVATTVLVTGFSGAFADDKTSTAPRPVQMAQSASSCSGWKAICETRGPGCAAKFAQCMKSGCWTEGPAFGGATHCSLAKK